jgi:hypothetical protein
MTKEESDRLVQQVQHVLDANYNMYDRVLTLEAENRELREQLEGMKDVCATAIKNACIEAVRALPDLPPPRMPSAAQLTLVHPFPHGREMVGG